MTREAVHRTSRLPRVRLIKANSQSRKAVSALPIAPGSQDVIIDDGDHSPSGTQRTLLAMWPNLRPGGLYIIEDIITGSDADCERLSGTDCQPINASLYGAAIAPLVHDINWRSPSVQAIFEQNDIFFADTLVGHRAFNRFRAETGRAYGRAKYMRDRISHNSHLLVLRKRVVPRRINITMLTGHSALHR